MSTFLNASPEVSAYADYRRENRHRIAQGWVPMCIDEFLMNGDRRGQPLAFVTERAPGCRRCGVWFGADERDLDLCAPCEGEVESNEWRRR